MARFYTSLEPNPDLVHLYADLQAAARGFHAAGSAPRAIRTIELMEEVMRRLDRQAVASAAHATELIRQHIEATRVRPRASGRMAAHVVSHPIRTSVPSGAFGLADLDELDKSTPPARMGRRNIPYWMAQEFGSTAAVGRRVPGFFQPGNARPNPAEFRVHPFFVQVGPKAPRGTPAMVITKPIAARHFLRDGSRDAVAFHDRELNAIDRFTLRGIGRI